MENEIDKFRKLASEASLGSSSDDILKSILTYIKDQEIPNVQRVLDIGCGQGTLISYLKEIFPNSEFVGIDYSHFTEWDQSSYRFIQHDCNIDLPNDLGQFDLIVSSEVIEHLENGRHFVREIAKKLNSKGMMLISTPNLESFTSLLSFYFRGYHSAFGGNCYPAHILPVAAFDLKNMILETNQFEIKDIHFIKNGRIPKLKILWRNLIPFLSGKRFSDNYFISAYKK